MRWDSELSGKSRHNERHIRAKFAVVVLAYLQGHYDLAARYQNLFPHMKSIRRWSLGIDMCASTWPDALRPQSMLSLELPASYFGLI